MQSHLMRSRRKGNSYDARLRQGLRDDWRELLDADLLRRAIRAIVDERRRPGGLAERQAAPHVTSDSERGEIGRLASGGLRDR